MNAPRLHSADVRLARAALAGRTRSVAVLVQRLADLRATLSCLNRRMGRPLGRDDLDDLHQEVWMTIWRKLDTYEGRGVLEAWARRFAVYVFMNRVRRVAREKALDHELVGAGVASDDVDRNASLLEVVECWLEDLGSPEAEIIRLKQMSGFSFARIARELGIPLSTAKSRYYRGIDWLRSRASLVEDEPTARRAGA